MNAIALPLGVVAIIGAVLGTIKDLVHMAVTHVTAVRNLFADALDNYINTTGSANTGGMLTLRDSTTVVVEFDFSNPAFGASSSGVITLADTPIAAAAIAAGEVDNAQILDRDEGLVLSCSVTGAGGGGDIEVSNANIALAQDCSLDSLTYTASP